MGGGAATIDIGGLYADHGQWLRQWLGRRTRCPQRASDLAHDAFCRLLERPAVEPRDPRRYLATVARRLLVDDIRRRELERASLDAGFDEVDTLTPERIVEAAQLFEGVMRLLSGLPEEARRAFLMRRLDGLGHDDIAAELGVSVRTVKRRIAEAYAHCYAFVYSD